jgi:hypothetical protein
MDFRFLFPAAYLRGIHFMAPVRHPMAIGDVLWALAQYCFGLFGD